MAKLRVEFTEITGRSEEGGMIDTKGLSYHLAFRHQRDAYLIQADIEPTDTGAVKNGRDEDASRISKHFPCKERGV